MPELAPPAGACGLWDVAAPDYYADRTRVSHSALELFRRSIPEYAGVYVTGELDPPEPTEAMRLGTALHVLALEPDTWAERIAVAPADIDRRTTAGKRDWAAFQAAAGARVQLTAAQHELARGMADGLRRHPLIARTLDQAGRCEQALVWTCPATALALRCRLDKVLGNGLILDFKTTDNPDPEAFGKAVANFGYHRQGALYAQGARLALDADGPFVFAAIGKRPPHEVVTYALDAEALDLGQRQNDRLLAELAQCKAAGRWASRWHGQVQALRLPRWATYSD